MKFRGVLFFPFAVHRNQYRATTCEETGFYSQGNSCFSFVAHVPVLFHVM